MRKRKPLIVTGIVVFALVSIVCYYIWPRNIDKYYYGYCVDLNSCEIIDNCNINISGKYIKCASFDFLLDFKKIRGEFTGKLTINDLSYELYGVNCLNDENEYFTDKQGNKCLALTASEHCKEKYSLAICKEFNDKEVLIHNLSSNEVIIASNQNDLKKDDIMNILKNKL
ncbi:MAG: hypothetical protein E7213_00515 [Clostridium sp.]|nr:hypothetical protein [Clostridium sp.]